MCYSVNDWDNIMLNNNYIFDNNDDYYKSLYDIYLIFISIIDKYNIFIELKDNFEYFIKNNNKYNLNFKKISAKIEINKKYNENNVNTFII